MLTIKQKIVVACDKAGISLTYLANQMGMSQQTFSSRLKVGKFSQDELVKMGSIIGCEWKSGFYFSDGSKIE